MNSDEHSQDSSINDRHTSNTADGDSVKVTDRQGKDRKNSRQQKRKAVDIMRQSTPQVHVEMEPNPDRNADRTLRNITITISPTKKKVTTAVIRKGKSTSRQTDGIHRQRELVPVPHPTPI